MKVIKSSNENGAIMDNKKIVLNAIELQKYQPNRFPFLMIDYVTEVIPGVSAKGYKNLTNNEWYFPHHFLGAPNMPGALQLEALAQMLTVAITTLPDLSNKVVHGLKHTVRFKREVFPGNRLDIETKVLSWKRGVCIGKGVGYVDGVVACEADMVLSIPEIFKAFLPDIS